MYSYELVHMNATMESDKDVTVLDASITSSAVSGQDYHSNTNTIGKMKLIKRRCMLWIDVDPNEPGLSRVCLVNKTNLKAYKQQQQQAGQSGGGLGYSHHHLNRQSLSEISWYNRRSSVGSDEHAGTGQCQPDSGVLHDEDERFSKGLYMSDIAEVRVGCNSFVFRYAAAISMVGSKSQSQSQSDTQSQSTTPNTPNPLPFDPAQCFSIVGSERTIEIELVDPRYPPSITKNGNVMKRIGGGGTTTNSNSNGTRAAPSLPFRDYLADFMNLSVIHSLQLYEQEDVLRNKKW